MNEPITIRDLEWMRETSSGWFDGKIKHEQIRKPGEPIAEGTEEYSSVHVFIYGDTVAVESRINVVCEVRSERSFSLTTANRSRTEYEFDEFRESEWWPVCMEAWKGGMTDSSWMDDARFDDYGDDVSLIMKVSSAYTDFLGNRKQGKVVRTLCVRVEKSSGQVTLSFGGKEVGFDLDELLEMVETKKLMNENGVSVDAGGVRIDFAGGGAS